MKTTHFEENTNLKTAESYYRAMLEGDFYTLESYLDDHVVFIGPLAELHGKEAVVSAAKNLSKILQDIHIRSKFETHNQIMFAYDFMFPDPIGKLRAAVLMDFIGERISKIEVFYDGRPFMEKRDEIFNKS